MHTSPKEVALIAGSLPASARPMPIGSRVTGSALGVGTIGDEGADRLRPLRRGEVGPTGSTRPRCLEALHNAVTLQPSTVTEVRIGQVWEQVSKHERGMQLEVVRNTGPRWVLRPVGGGPSKKRGLREGVWTLSTEQINATCRLVRDVG